MLVFVDCFSKMRHLVLIIFIKVEEATYSFYTYVWKHYDLSEFFMSDQDTQFIFNVWKHICKMLKINIKLFIAYHFEINDQIKRFNTVIKHYLQVYVNYMQNNWAKWLSEVKFAINNAFSLITLALFFLINLNQNSHLDFKLFESLLENFTFQAWNKLINVEDFIKKMKKLIDHLHDEMLIA